MGGMAITCDPAQHIRNRSRFGATIGSCQPTSLGGLVTWGTTPGGQAGQQHRLRSGLWSPGMGLVQGDQTQGPPGTALVR